MDEDTDSLVNDGSESTPQKMVSPDHVNDIVKKRLSEQAEKIRREMQELHAQELENLKSSQANSGFSNEGQSPKIQEIVSQLVSQEIAKIQEQEQERVRQLQFERNKEELEKGMQSFSMKMAAGVEKDPELEEVMKDYDLQAFPYAAYLAGKVDNTPEVMKELARNPMKAKEIDDMAGSSGKTAAKMIEKISLSIAKNQEALENNIQTNAPLSRLKSSNVGADSGKMSLKDFKNADYNLG